MKRYSTTMILDPEGPWMRVRDHGEQIAILETALEDIILHWKYSCDECRKWPTSDDGSEIAAERDHMSVIAEAAYLKLHPELKYQALPNVIKERREQR